MKKSFIFLLLGIFGLVVNAQSYRLTDDDFAHINTIEVLKDNGYMFEKVLGDSSLVFSTSPVLQDFKSNSYYWVKCKVFNPYKTRQKYYLKVLPQLDNTLYVYDDEEGVWKTERFGLSVPNNKRLYGIAPCIFAKGYSTIYIKVGVSALSAYSFSTKASISLLHADYFTERENVVFGIWIATLAIMLMFFIYNAYIYFLFKDNTYLYYLVIVIGGMLYITGLSWYFNLLSEARIFNIEMTAKGNIFYFDINQTIRDFGIIVVIFGFIQLTRSYLETRAYLPRWDKVLNYILIAFVVVNVVNILLTISGIYYTNNLIATPENIAIVLIILLLLWIGGVSYRRGFKPAKYFLYANILPLTIMLVLSAYYALFYFNNFVINMLPNLAIVSQTLTFAIALVARINLLKEELKNRQLEAQILKTEKESILLQNEIEKQALQREFSQQLIQTQEGEKQRISRELHDSIGQNILFIKNQLSKNNADNHLSPIIDTVNDTIEEVRDIAKDLYPNQLEKYGLAAAVEALGEKVGESSQMFISADFQDTEKYLSKERMIHIYRIIQECINNALKHAEASALRITAEVQGDTIHCLIQDNGKGFNQEILAKKQQRSFGLLGIEERVKILGGKLEVESGLNQGTKLSFHLPYVQNHHS